MTAALPRGIERVVFVVFDGLRPDLVRMDLAADFSPLMSELAADYRHLSPIGAGRLAWMAQDLHPSGACGDARDADAERGRALVDHAAQTLIALLREIDRYPLERLRSWPGAATP